MSTVCERSIFVSLLPIALSTAAIVLALSTTATVTAGNTSYTARLRVALCLDLLAILVPAY